MKKWRVKCMSHNGNNAHVVSSHLTERKAEQKKQELEKGDPHSYYWVIKE